MVACIHFLASFMILCLAACELNVSEPLGDAPALPSLSRYRSKAIAIEEQPIMPVAPPMLAGHRAWPMSAHDQGDITRSQEPFCQCPA